MTEGVYSLFNVRPGPDGQLQRRRTARFSIADAHVTHLEDHDDQLAEVPEGPLSPETVAGIRRLSGPYRQLVRWTPEYGDDPHELPEFTPPRPFVPTESGPVSRPPVFEYHREGMTRPHTVEVRGDGVVLNGSALSPEESAKLLDNVKTGVATLRYKTVGQVGKYLGKHELAKSVIPPDENLRGEEGYLYHATNEERAAGIAESGHMLLHRPWDFTDQEAWPDGATEKRSGYFTTHHAAHTVWNFQPEEGKGAVLRIRNDAHPFRKEKGTGDFFSKRPIPAHHFEIQTEEGWQPLLDWHKALNKNFRHLPLPRVAFNPAGDGQVVGELPDLKKSDGEVQASAPPEPPKLDRDVTVPAAGNLAALDEKRPEGLVAFVEVNDQWKHLQQGWRETDEALRELGEVLRSSGGDPYRVSDDLFVVFYPDSETMMKGLRGVSEPERIMRPSGVEPFTVAVGTAADQDGAWEELQTARRLARQEPGHPKTLIRVAQDLVKYEPSDSPRTSAAPRGSEP